MFAIHFTQKAWPCHCCTKTYGGEGLSQSKAAACMGLLSSLITRWVKQQSALLDTAKKPKLSSHPGPDSQLHDIKDSLLQFIFENGE